MIFFVYEIDKKHPVGVIFPSGIEISLDPWDVEMISEYGKFEYIWEEVQK